MVHAGMCQTSYDFLNLLYIEPEEGNYCVYTCYRKNTDGTFFLIDRKKVKQAMPQVPTDPAITFQCDEANNSVQIQVAKAKWEHKVLYFTEDETINRALIKTFLSMLPVAYCTGFTEMLRSDPNMTFIEIFGHFFNQFSHTAPAERHTEQQLVTASW